MRPFRQNVAIAIDGGGIKGIIVSRALAILETYLSLPVRSIFQLAAGTSTGAILAAGIASGLTATHLTDLYSQTGETIFRKSWRSRVWPLTRYRYSISPLTTALEKEFGTLRMGELWENRTSFDMVLTTFDLAENRTRFIKPWKNEYRDWPVTKAVLSSCAVPTFFPVVEGRYVDGGVGGYSNPCFLAAYELLFCLGWKPSETTLISLGTGRSPDRLIAKQANRLWTWQWIEPMINAFMQSADDQQVHLVNTFFQELDFRRFQINLQRPVAMDDASQIPDLLEYGDQLGLMILNDEIDPTQEIFPRLAPPNRKINFRPVQ